MTKPLCFNRAYLNGKTVKLESDANIFPEDIADGLIEVYGKQLDYRLGRTYSRDANLLKVTLEPASKGRMEIVRFSDDKKQVLMHFPSEEAALRLYQYVKNYALKREPEADKELISRLAAGIHWETGIIEVRTEELFKIDSGQNRSPYYINERLLSGYPTQERMIISHWAAILDSDKVKFDAIAGIESAGMPPAKALAKELNTNFIWVRKNPLHEGGPQIEGAHLYTLHGKKILVADDTIAQGSSKLRAIDILKNAGAKVTDCAVIADRLEGGENTLKKIGVNLHSVTDFDTISNVGLKKGHIDIREWGEVQNYHNDPKGWHKSHGLKYYKIDSKDKIDTKTDAPSSVPLCLHKR
jgi:orotate phosphoribosyltransferase